MLQQLGREFTSYSVSESIEIKDLELVMYLGIHDREKENPQRVLVSLTIVPPLEYLNGGFLDYDAIVSQIIETYSNSHIETQEQMCNEIADWATATYRVRSISVSTKKPDIFPNCKYVSYCVSKVRS